MVTAGSASFAEEKPVIYQEQAGHRLRHPPMASLPDAEDKAGTQKQLLDSLGRLWLAGVGVNDLNEIGILPDVQTMLPRRQFEGLS